MIVSSSDDLAVLGGVLVWLSRQPVEAPALVVEHEHRGNAGHLPEAFDDRLAALDHCERRRGLVEEPGHARTVLVTDGFEHVDGDDADLPAETLSPKIEKKTQQRL